VIAADTGRLLSAAVALREAMADTPLRLEFADAVPARELVRTAVRQLDDYVLPRLRDVDAPVLAVVGGSTGAGKSTLVNSLVGDLVSQPGVLRPTTRSPVLVHHPDAERWFADDRVLPTLARVRGDAAGVGELQLVARPTVPEMLALLDAPDIDSVVDSNRELATQLLDAADLWVFVTTAARYADAVPWEFLHAAVARGVGIGLVLNRVPTGAETEVSEHLADMLRHEGLGDAPLFTIGEQPLLDGRLPERAVEPLRTWLTGLAVDQRTRAELVRRTLAGTVDELAGRTDRVAAVVEYQREMASWLDDRVSDAFRRAAGNIDDDVRDGTVMRGEVLARWQDLVGTGELLRQLQSTIGRWRDRLGAAMTGRETTGDRFQGAVTSGVETLVLEHAARAVDEVIGTWRAQPAGAALIATAGADGIDLTHPSPDLAERTNRMVRDWQAALLDLIRREGAGRRRTARALSYGVNGVALVLMVGVFSQTGGLTGAEVAIAGGSSAVAQKLLEALLGDQAVRRLAAEARADLVQRVHGLLASEADRFRSTLQDAQHEGSDARRLHELARRLREAATA
jgi:hypothetical protein